MAIKRSNTTEEEAVQVLTQIFIDRSPEHIYCIGSTKIHEYYIVKIDDVFYHVTVGSLLSYVEDWNIHCVITKVTTTLQNQLGNKKLVNKIKEVL